MTIGEHDTALRGSDVERLARMAARLAGRNPDQHIQVKLADEIAFDDVAWRYPDFLRRAEAAYAVLTDPTCPAG